MADGPFLVVDTEACAGHGRCYAMAPKSFEPDDSGYAVTTGRVESDRTAAELADIVNTCPEEAIAVNGTLE